MLKVLRIYVEAAQVNGDVGLLCRLHEKPYCYAIGDTFDQLAIALSV